MSLLGSKSDGGERQKGGLKRGRRGGRKMT